MPTHHAGRFLVIAATVLVPFSAWAQGVATWSPDKRGSDNLEVVAHLPLGPRLSVADIDIEQELDRPYAYVGRVAIFNGERGTDIIDLREPSAPRVLYSWRIEDQDLHQGAGGMDVKHFKWNDRYYVIQSLQFGQGGPNADLGAVVLDVTGLPDPDAVREVARIRLPEAPGGFHNIFVYRHSNGRVLLFTTVRGPFAHVYDLGYLVDGAGGEHGEAALVAKVPVATAATDRAAATTICTSAGIRTPSRTASTAAAQAGTTSSTSPTWRRPGCRSR